LEELYVVLEELELLELVVPDEEEWAELLVVLPPDELEL
jgi:hypothetical protein